MNLNSIDLWDKIIYNLNGTCDSLEQALADNEAEKLEDHTPFLHYLDNEIFRCNCCSWWYPISEMAENDNWECRDCAPDEED
jgi:hypothetical protein